MKDYETRLLEAKAYSAWGDENAKNGTFKTKQKFPRGARVKTTEKNYGTEGIVFGTYAQQFGGDNIDSYTITFDDGNQVSWYSECLMTLIETEDINLNYNSITGKTSVTVTKNGEEVEQSSFSLTTEAVSLFLERTNEAKKQVLKRIKQDEESK